MNSRHAGTRGLVRSIFSNWVTFVFSAVVNFVLAPIVVRELGETQYGAWVLLVSMVGNLGLLDLGVRAAVTRYMAHFHAAGDHASASRLYSSAIRIFSIAGVIAIAISVVMAFLVGSVFNVPPDLVRIARIVAVLGGINVAVSLTSGVFGGVLIGLERFDYNNGVEIAVSILRVAGVLITLKTGQGLIGLAVVQLVATVLRGVCNIFLVRWLYPELDLTPSTWDRESTRLIFKYGLTASMLHVSGALMLYSDSLVIGAFLPVAMVTYFAIAGNLSDYARSIVGGISQTLTPRISAMQAGGQHAALSGALLTNARLSTLVVLPIATTFMLRGHSFIGLWMGAAYADLSGRVLLILSLSLVTLAGYQVVAAAMFGINKHGGLIPIFVGETVVNLVLSIILVRRFGVIGTAVGTAIPRLVVSTLICPWYVRKTLGIPVRAFWTSVFLQPMLAMIPFAAASYAIERAWPARNLLVYFGQVAVLMPLVAISAWVICFTPAERAVLTRVVQRPASSNAQ